MPPVEGYCSPCYCQEKALKCVGRRILKLPHLNRSLRDRIITMTLVDTSISGLDLLNFSGLKTLQLRNNSLLHCSRIAVRPGVLLTEDCRTFETTLLPLLTTAVGDVQTTQHESNITTAVVGGVSRIMPLSTCLAGGITLETTKGSKQPGTMVADTTSIIYGSSSPWGKNTARASDATVSSYPQTTSQDPLDYTTTDGGVSRIMPLSTRPASGINSQLL